MSTVAALRARLLAWYDRNGRALPWRESADPYRVWLSEIMLQQTTVAHATRYFLAFTDRWPTVEALAGAEDGEVMAAWAGLGYYARARNLLACARAVRDDHGGVFPDTEAALRALPGLGAYTAAAVAAIAFGRPANVVDANVERVMARLYAVETPLPAARPRLRELAGNLATAHRPADWAQALMDLGAMVCRPSTPECPACPLAGDCAARARGAPGGYPRKVAKADRPHRHGVAFALFDGDKVALERRAAKGLLGGMLGLPTTDWRSAPWSEVEARPFAPAAGAWRGCGSAEHVFTHFSLTLQVRAREASPALRTNTLSWTGLDEALAGLPTVFAKALRLAIAGRRG